MKAFNSVYFRQPIDFIFEFLPQIILLWALFGYMDFLILNKWLTDWSEPQNNSANAPSIITTMINMFLNGGKPDKDFPLFPG